MKEHTMQNAINAQHSTHLDRSVFASANRHGVDGMDRHARHLSLMTLEGVDGRRSGDHSPAARGSRSSSPGGSVTAYTTGQPQPSPVGVDLGALRRGPLQLQHLLLQAGDGRPLLLEDGSRGRSRRRLAGLGLARGRIGMRQGRGRRGKVISRTGEEVLVDPRVEVGPLPIGKDHGEVLVVSLVLVMPFFFPDLSTKLIILLGNRLTKDTSYTHFHVGERRST